MSLKKHIKAFLNPDFKYKKDIIKINRIYALFAGLLTPVLHMVYLDMTKKD
jgi:hypothetical protein